MRLRTLSMLVFCAALVVPSGCGSEDNEVNPFAPADVEGIYVVSVVEATDTCDDVNPIVLEMGLEIRQEQDDEYIVKFINLFSRECWEQPATLRFDELSWNGGFVNYDQPCNEGCQVQVESTATWAFERDGRVDGSEVMTFTPLSAECDAAACQGDCDFASGHLLLPPNGRVCPVGCETTYSWIGRQIDGAILPDCV